jgi:hypothetical protein
VLADYVLTLTRISPLDWITIVGLIVAVFGNAWAIFDRNDESVKWRISGIIALCSGIVALGALIIERNNSQHYRSIIRGDILEFVSQGQTYWTAEELYSAVEQRHSNLDIDIRSLFKDVIVTLENDGRAEPIEERMFGSKAHPFNDDSAAHTRHLAILYCQHCGD